MKNISSNIYQLSGAWGSGDIWGGNVFLLAGHKVTIVDAGYRGSAERIIKAIRSLGHTTDDIENIIITHHHADHIGGLASLKKMVAARVLAHKDDAQYISGEASQPGPTRPPWLKFAIKPFRRLWATSPVPVDIKLRDGDELAILEGTKVVHAPGHTPGGIVLYVPAQKLLIVGDLLTHGNKLKLPSREFTVDTNRELVSIQKILLLDFEVMCFGHGLPIMAEARFQVKSFAKNLGQKYQFATQGI